MNIYIFKYIYYENIYFMLSLMILSTYNKYYYDFYIFGQTYII